MHFKLLYPSTYLGAHDLQGRDVVLTIRRVVVEDLKTERGTERKPVVYFVETQRKAEKDHTDEKRLVLNKTNATTIAAMHGNEVNAWNGKRITLYAAPVSAFGKEVEAIRVRPTAPPSATAPTDPATSTTSTATPTTSTSGD